MAAATALVLGSALLHAGWNLAVKRSGDQLVAMWGANALGGLLLAPLLLVIGAPAADAVPYLLGSAIVHVAYSLLLTRAYAATDLSVAYPVARGISPLLTALGGAVLLDDPLNGTGYAGVALVTIGLIGLGLTAGRRRGLGWAVATGVAITSYTLIDAAGVRAGEESLRYVIGLMATSGALLTTVVFAARGGRLMAAARRAGWPGLIGAGLASLAAYALVLAAIRLAAVGHVAGLREASVVFGAIGGWVILHEPLGARRTTGASVVAAGLIVLVVSGFG
jgi:drug/metabolite transporter (DMT)-like permease